MNVWTDAGCQAEFPFVCEAQNQFPPENRLKRSFKKKSCSNDTDIPSVKSKVPQFGKRLKKVKVSMIPPQKSNIRTDNANKNTWRAGKISEKQRINKGRFGNLNALKRINEQKKETTTEFIPVTENMIRAHELQDKDVINNNPESESKPCKKQDYTTNNRKRMGKLGKRMWKTDPVKNSNNGNKVIKSGRSGKHILNNQKGKSSKGLKKVCQCQYVSEAGPKSVTLQSKARGRKSGYGQTKMGKKDPRLWKMEAKAKGESKGKGKMTNSGKRGRKGKWKLRLVQSSKGDQGKMTKESKFNMAHRNIKGMKGYSKQGRKNNGMILGSIRDKWKDIFKRHFGNMGDKWKNFKNGNMMMSWSYNSHDNKPKKVNNKPKSEGSPAIGKSRKSGSHQFSSDPKYEWYYTYEEYYSPNHQTGSRSTMHHCPNGFEQLGGKCYLFLDEKRSYQDGRKDCHDKNAILAQPKSREEADLIAHKFGSDPEFWIGVYSQDGQR